MSSSLKIAYDAKRLFNNSTGLGNYARSLVKSMYQYYPENTYQLFTPKINEQLNTGFFKENFSIKTAQKTPKVLWRSYGMNREIQADVFHGLSNEIPFGLKKIKKVVTIHDLIFKHYPNTYPKLDRWLYDQKSKYTCENADRIIAISQSTKQDIINFYNVPPQKIQVVYQSCQPVFYQKENTDKKAVKEKFNLPSEFILSVGSIIERKNVLNLVKAILQLKNKNIPPLVIIGKGKKYKQKVQQFIAENKLNKKIFFLEQKINTLELKAIYEMAEIMVYPSLYEGFGLPVLESLLCKTPVVTSNLSSLPEAAGKHSALVSPLSSDEIAHAIFDILQNSNKQDMMKEKGYQYAIEHFLPQQVSQQLEELYRNLL